MYGLRHQHIRIEDQQLNLKMNKMKNVFELKIDNIYVTPINLFPMGAFFASNFILKTNPVRKTSIISLN